MRFTIHGLAVLACTTMALATVAPWPARLPLHLALLVAAGLAWAHALWSIGRTPAGPRDRVVLVAVALCLRLPAWFAPPAHSDDVYRYAWDGRVARAGHNPYDHAPTDPRLAALRDDAIHPRINHPDLPTIYPPAAQGAFLVAAWLPLPPISALTLIFGACDLGVLAILMARLRREGKDLRWAATWGWSPLVVIEIAVNAHGDALGILALTAGLALLARGRVILGGALLGAATAAKWITAPLLLVQRSSRVIAAGLGVIALLLLPYLGAGARITGSSGEFARRWRGNDGASALVTAATDRLVCAALGAPRISRAPDDDRPACERPLDLAARPALAHLISGRDDRAAVYPDELSAFATRAILGAALLGLLAWLRLRRRPTGIVDAADDEAELLLGALLLLTPALKPWYVPWLLPLVARSRRPAWIALAALVPLAYVPTIAFLSGEPNRDPAWTRVVEHGACWALLALELLRARKRG